MEKEDFKNLYNKKRWKMKNCILLIIAACCITAHSFAQVLYNPSADNKDKGTLAELHIDVVIKGGKAVTTLDMWFYNARWGDVEGELTFRLNAHQSISDFMVRNAVDGDYRIEAYYNHRAPLEKEKVMIAWLEIYTDFGTATETNNNSSLYE